MVNLKELPKKIRVRNSPARTVAGVVVIILGCLALITPFTPGSWLIFIGLGILGVRLAVWDRIKLKIKNKFYGRPK